MCSRCAGAHQDVLEHIWSTYGAHIANSICAPYVLVHICMCLCTSVCAPYVHQMCTRCARAHLDVFQMRWCTSGCAGAHMEHIWCTYCKQYMCTICARAHLYVLVHICMCTICAPDVHQMCSSTFRCVPDALVHIRMCWSTYGAHMVHILQTVYVHHMCSCTSVCACAHLNVHHMCTRCAPDVLEHV